MGRVDVVELVLEVVSEVLVVTGVVTGVDVDDGVVLTLVFVVMLEADEVDVGASVPAVFWKHLQALLIEPGLTSANSLGTTVEGEERYAGQKAAAREEKRSKARSVLSSKQTSARLSCRG